MIADLEIGIDQINGLTAIAAADIAQLGTVAALDEVGISELLTASDFGAGLGATFTLASALGSGIGERTFLALNDGTAGFEARTDGIVEITGFSGSLAELAII